MQREYSRFLDVCVQGALRELQHSIVVHMLGRAGVVGPTHGSLNKNTENGAFQHLGDQTMPGGRRGGSNGFRRAVTLSRDLRKGSLFVGFPLK